MDSRLGGGNRAVKSQTHDGVELPNEVEAPQVQALWHLLNAEGLMPKYRTEAERKQTQEIAVRCCPTRSARNGARSTIDRLGPLPHDSRTR